MKNIFLSRPNWIYPDCQDGLKNFLSILKSHELTPRTIGSTDYPTTSPMNAVIDLMHECEGAIILGYSQIEILSGNIKDSKIENAKRLATEWNHIEGALAYSLGLPLFVIHDTNISRGIFDRGVLDRFLYQKDFRDKSWASSEDISGALLTWKKSLRPITKQTHKPITKESPTLKWGCFTFPHDEKLYCPFCYNTKGEKMLTIRVDSKKRQCTNCEKYIPSG